jgi:post-segregation antitoxin (ccd killing protein)
MKSFKKEGPMVNTSLRVPKHLLDLARKKKINMSAVFRDALEKATD